MNAKYVKGNGENYDFVATAAVSAGTIVVNGGLIGVCNLDVAAGGLGTIDCGGTYDVDLGGTTAGINVGATIYWNDTEKKIELTGTTANVALGYAVEKIEANSGAATVRTILKGV